jgi:hypothetical protein
VNHGRGDEDTTHDGRSRSTIRSTSALPRMKERAHRSNFRGRSDMGSAGIATYSAPASPSICASIGRWLHTKTGLHVGSMAFMRSAIAKPGLM